MQDFSWESIWANIQKENIELQARTNVNKEVLFDVLKKNNVEVAIVTFNGSGDSGSIDNVELTPESTQPLLEETAVGFSWPNYAGLGNLNQNVLIKDAIETICYDLLRLKHQGWETNEGAHGTFEFVVKDNKIKLDFYERSIANYEDEF